MRSKVSSVSWSKFSSKQETLLRDTRKLLRHEVISLSPVTCLKSYSKIFWQKIIKLWNLVQRGADMSVCGWDKPGSLWSDLQLDGEDWFLCSPPGFCHQASSVTEVTWHHCAVCSRGTAPAASGGLASVSGLASDCRFKHSFCVRGQWARSLKATRRQ